MLICRNLYRERNFPTASRAYTKINLFYAYISEAIKLVNRTCLEATQTELFVTEICHRKYSHIMCADLKEVSDLYQLPFSV